MRGAKSGVTSGVDTANRCQLACLMPSRPTIIVSQGTGSRWAGEIETSQSWSAVYLIPDLAWQPLTRWHCRGTKATCNIQIANIASRRSRPSETIPPRGSSRYSPHTAGTKSFWSGLSWLKQDGGATVITKSQLHYFAVIKENIEMAVLRTVHQAFYTSSRWGHYVTIRLTF